MHSFLMKDKVVRANSRHCMPTAGAGNSTFPAWVACMAKPGSAEPRRSLVVGSQGAANAADSSVRVRFSTHFQVRACILAPGL